jgi:hypothetical protein
MKEFLQLLCMTSVRPLDQVLDVMMDHIPQKFDVLTLELFRIKRSYCRSPGMYRLWWDQVKEELSYYLGTASDWERKIQSIFFGSIKN